MNNTTSQMKSRRQNKTGLTLTELLVATILMGIVMLGIVSVDYAVKQMTKQTSGTAFLKMYTSATLQDIARNAAMMTGDSTHPGLLVFFNRFYIRQDINAATGAVNNTPNNDDDDAWICYDQSQGGGAPNRVNIIRCRFNATVGSPLVADVTKNCADASAFATTTIGTAVDNTLAMQFLPDNNTGANATQQYYLEISLTNRKNPLLAASCTNPTSAATCSNPEDSESTRVYPFSQHSQLPADAP